MESVFVIYHQEDDGWWADSPGIAGWSAAAASLGELRTLVDEGVRFALERGDIAIQHVMIEEVPVPAQLLYDFVNGRTLVRPEVGSGESLAHLTLAAR